MTRFEVQAQTRVLRFEQNRLIFRVGAVLLLVVGVVVLYVTRELGQAWGAGALGMLIVLFLGHSRQVVLDGPQRRIRHRLGFLVPLVTVGGQDMSPFKQVWIRIVDEGGTDSVDLWFGIGISGQGKDVRLALRRKHAAAVETAKQIAALINATVVDHTGGSQLT